MDIVDLTYNSTREAGHVNAMRVQDSVVSEAKPTRQKDISFWPLRWNTSQSSALCCANGLLTLLKVLSTGPRGTMPTLNAQTDGLHLTRFPSDILAQVVSFTPLALRLWLSGDAEIRRKLESGVLEVTLTDRRWISLGKPPVVLARFKRLRHLSFQTGTGPVANENTTLAQHIADLSTTLTSLAIPLHIYGRLPTLPPSLTSLEIYDTSVMSGIRIKDMSILPRSLEKMLASVEYNSSDDWSLPPPSLSTIRFLQLYSDEEDLLFLPRTLTACFLVPASPFTASMLRSLPPGLTSLELTQKRNSFQSAETEWYHSLPTSLKCLWVSGSERVDLRAISQLPRSLTALQASSIDWDDIVSKEEEGADVDVWPPNLTDLAIIDQVMHDYQLYLLPRTLKTLSTNFWPNKELDCSGFPPSITDVRWRVSSDRHTPTAPVSIVSLPSKLAQSIAQWDMEAVPRNFRVFEHWTSLTSLHMDWTGRLPSIKADRVKLPPTLTELKSTLWHWDWFESIPSRIVAIEFENVDGKLPSCEDAFAKLPSGLRHLAMGLTATSRIDTLIFGPKSFSTLLRLESIDAPFLGEFESGILRNIAKMPYLRNLDITLVSLEQKDAPFIPQNLNHDLSLGPKINAQLPYIARHWPTPDYSVLYSDEESLKSENRTLAKKRPHW